MNPHRYIEDLCRRYGVSRQFGKRLLPLVERAQVVDPDKRARLLDLVTRSFEQEARRVEEHDPPRSQVPRLTQEERKVLRTVSTILHNWSPPGWLEQWGEGGEGT